MRRRNMLWFFPRRRSSLVCTSLVWQRDPPGCCIRISEKTSSRHLGELVGCDNKDTLVPRRGRDLFEDLHIPIPIVVTAVVHLAALLTGGSLLWFYRRPILTHLGKLGMALLVFGLAFSSLSSPFFSAAGEER